MDLYDYKKRFYDPALGRFISVDPLASSFPWWTPYQFAGLMPTKYVDLDGMEPAYWDPQTQTVIPASDHLRHNPPADAQYLNQGSSNDSELAKLLGRGSSVTETGTSQRVMEQTDNVKKVNKFAKKLGPIVTITTVADDAMNTDFEDPEQVGDFVENTVQSALESTPVIGPGLGVLADDAKEEDGVTNVENMAKSYQKSYNDRNQLLQRFLEIRRQQSEKYQESQQQRQQQQQQQQQQKEEEDRRE